MTLGIAHTQRQEDNSKQRTNARPAGRMWDYGDDNRGPEMAVIALVMTSLSVIAVALRCYTMIAILKRFLVEDWLAVLTCVSTTNACLPVESVLMLHFDTSSFSVPSAPL